MQDFKRNTYRDKADQHPEMWQELLTGALAGAILCGIMIHGFILATGGY